MTQLFVTDGQGVEHTVEGADDGTLMEVIRGAGFEDLIALCSGNCSCATCHVYIGQTFLDRLPPIGPDEDDLLDSSSHRRAGSRLSCQIAFGPDLEGLKVTIAPED